MLLKRLFLFILFVGSTSGFAQTYSSTLYSIDDGLVQSQIRCIGQDKHGYLWFGSYTSGASRFNGKEFESFTLDNGLCANTIHDMLEDKDGNLWMGTYGDGLCRYDGETFTHYGIDEGFPGTKIYSMLEATNGMLYFGTDSGVVNYDGKQFNNLHDQFPSFKLDLVRSMVQGKDGTIYFGGSRRGVAKLKNNSISYIDSQGERLSVFSLHLDKASNLWIGTRKGVYKSNNREFTYISAEHSTSGNIIRCFYEDQNGTLWAGSTGGLYQIKNDRFHAVHLSGATETVNAQTFYRDKEGNTWVATQIGAFLIKKELFENYTQQDGLAHNYVFAIEKHNNAIWLGGYDGGIMLLNNKEITPFSENDELKSDRIFALASHPETKELYIGTAKGINVYDDKLRSPSYVNLLDGNKVYDLFIDSKGNVWAGTADIGIAVFKDNELIERYTTKNGLSDDRVFAIDEDDNGVVWVATDHGINAIKNGKVITSLNETNGLLQDRCQDLLVDVKNNIWVSHNVGVSLYDGKTFRTYTTKEGLSSSSIFLMAEDESNNLWLGNNKTLDRIDLDQFYKNDSLQVKTYDRSNGYIGLESNQKAVYIDGKYVWFGSINGIAKYDPTKEALNQAKPQMILTDIHLFFDQPIKSDTTLELSYRENHLTFDFIGLSYYAPDKVQYSYIMEGLDEKWCPPTTETSATFSNLPPGAYVFKVKACNEDGIWSDPITYEFTIIPPFWKTTWFYILCVIVIAFGIYLIISYRTKKLRRDKIYLEEEVTRRTKELNDANVTIAKKNRDITDSINYAKRIQSALLPDDTEMRYSFDSFFYLYKPKDIVSGDFYWFHDFGDIVVCAVGDCTGHGVPGALMSVICVTQINKHVKSDSIQTPKEALKHINDGIVETLKQQEVNVNSYDGMDIAMCAYHKGTGQLEYAGAYRPLIIVRDGKILEYAPNRFSLGGEIMPAEKYIGHQIELKPNDCVYMFTDGYPDQFGGPRNKKYMSKRFKKLLVDISSESFDEQEKILERTFIEWMKDNEQVDDILVMGFKVSK